MSEVLNPMVAIVPALGENSVGAQRLRAALDQNRIRGVRVHTNMGETRRDTWEYMLATSPAQRSVADRHVEGHRGLLAECGALVVVNDLTEHVLDPEGEQITEIPNSVGYYAARVITAANQVYGGPGNGRVFLSGPLPNSTGLFAVDSRAKAVTVARLRMIDLYPKLPITLHGDFGPVAEIARYPREGASLQIFGEGEA